MDILCLRFYWPRIRRGVEEYVKNCHECQRLKRRHEFKAYLGDVSEPTLPFDVTGMYIVGLFPVTANKYRYLLTFVDHLTHYAEAVPIQGMTEQQCARAYASQIIARHGAGSKLISDLGRKFTSAFFRQTCKILSIKEMLTTAYHPEANGKLERRHKSLCEGL